MLNAAVEAKVIDDATLQEQIAPKVLALAKTGADAQLWNVAAYTHRPRGPLRCWDLSATHGRRRTTRDLPPGCCI